MIEDIFCTPMLVTYYKVVFAKDYFSEITRQIYVQRYLHFFILSYYYRLAKHDGPIICSHIDFTEIHWIHVAIGPLKISLEGHSMPEL